MDSIYLIGFMGSGKTTIANHLAKKLRLPVQDTDKMVESYYQMKIKHIFEKYGEATFRMYEQNMLSRSKKENCIVSTGGGIIETQENVDMLKSYQTIFLQTSWEVIVDRLKEDKDRPIWNNQQRDKLALLHKRTDNYMEASSFIVNTDGKTSTQIVDEIITLIK